MKDRSRISELNPDTAPRCVSSHCYQTSSSVGRMAETYTPQSFLGFHLKRGYPTKTVESASEKSPYTSPKGLRRTHSRTARRHRARACAHEKILSGLPFNSSFEDKMRAIYPLRTIQKETADFNRKARALKHVTYGVFVHQFNKRFQIPGCTGLKMTKYLYSEVFSPDYTSQLPRPYSPSSKTLELAMAHMKARYQRFLSSCGNTSRIQSPLLKSPDYSSGMRSAVSRSTPAEWDTTGIIPRSVNSSEYTPATHSIPRSTTIARDRYSTHSTPIVRERYSTQIGGLTFYGPKSGSVAALSRTGAATSKTNQANYTPQAGKVPVDISTLVTFPDNIQEGLHLLYHLCSFRNYCHSGLAIVLFYVLLRVVIDLCLTIRFVVGLLLGFFIPKPSYASAYPPQRARPFYVPQSGEAETLELAPESSDFQGVKPDAIAAEPTAPVPLATNKDHSSCLASSSTSSSLPASGHLVNTSVGFAMGLRSPAKPPPAPRQVKLNRSLGFGC